ncbi:MAG TPA: hypothetical protein VGO99_05395 [Leifsonia sp.]|nr:hypothetical protein [Leifsonia sp.]
MEQRRRPARWAFALGATVVALVLASAGVAFAVSTTLPDKSGESVGITGVTVETGTGPTATPTPTGSPTSTPTPTPTTTDTGAVTVPDPTPVPADDHGGDRGNRGKGGSGGGD